MMDLRLPSLAAGKPTQASGTRRAEGQDRVKSQGQARDGLAVALPSGIVPTGGGQARTFAEFIIYQYL